MNPSPLNLWKIRFNAIILAVLIHIAFFSLFTFSFPNINQSIKPSFHFLGSILESDLKSSNERSSKTNQPLPIIPPAVYPKKISEISPNKPLLNQHLTKANEKEQIKSTFIESTAPQNTEVDLKSLGINSDASYYEPLRINR